MNTLNRINEIKEQITNLVERLEETGSYGLIFYEDFVVYSDDFAERKYLGDMIDEWADAQVSLCYSSLWSWVRDEGAIAQDYIQRAVAEGIVDCKEFDIYKAIQSAQYLFYSDEVYAAYSTLEQLHKLHRELAELEREQVA